MSFEQRKIGSTSTFAASGQPRSIEFVAILGKAELPIAIVASWKEPIVDKERSEPDKPPVYKFEDREIVLK